MTAEELLEQLRPGIEEILEKARDKFGDEIPTCTSQSLRAIRALEAIDQFLSMQRLMGLSVMEKENYRIHSWRAPLKDFLCVHRAVVLIQHASCQDMISATVKPEES